jgi:large subunit ribosomal protein L4
VLLVIDRTEDAVWKSFRNLGVRVQIVLPEELNAYDVLVNDYVVFSKATLEAAIARYSERAPAGASTSEEASDDGES